MERGVQFAALRAGGQHDALDQPPDRQGYFMFGRRLKGYVWR